MKTSELRQAYLEFFKQRGHRVYPSDSLIPVGDASLLFTGAGMNQFKPYFLGLKKDLTRAASCQKCLRTADLDRVGKTDYHHTFFEMLGNFSFGDYFKKEAIAWGWEFVTKVLKLPEDRLWVSVYQDDPEAYEIWKNEIGLPESKIVKMGPEDNFWPANAPKDGPNGPCGPCSEIYVGEVPGKGVEIWNLVFTQFDRQSDGSLLALPQKNIDTGMGLERTASILQGVKSNFDTDTFVEIRAGLKGLLKEGSSFTTSENAVMDHVRAAVFSIADGALPSNEGRGYVIRKLIRLSCDHLEKAGARERGLLHEVVPMVTQAMGSAYPDLVKRQNELMSVVQNEQRMYEEARRRAGNARQGSMTSAEYAFSLYDTYGLPLDSIREKLTQESVAFDEAGYQALLEGQKERSRSSSKIAGEIFAKSGLYDLLEGIAPTRFMGYTTTHGAGDLLMILKDGQKVDSAKNGDTCVLVFDQSPFYAESGGQVADLGVVRGPGVSADVVDTQSHEKVILHHVKVTQGTLVKGQIYSLVVEPARRGDVMKNHTATHLLHSALRKVLGDHVKQSGSLVAPDYLRFDFTHFNAVEPEALVKIENMVNEQVRRNATLDKKVMSKDEAVKQGAIAFFGEKYGDEVRVVSMADFSKELCGGTHLSTTGEIELFKITSESSIQAGVRRIEAVTGHWAKKQMGEAIEEIEKLAGEFKVKPEQLAGTLKESLAKVKTVSEKLELSIEPRMRKTYDEAFALAPQAGSVRIFERREPDATPDLFQKMFAHLKNVKEPFVVLWQCGKDGKATFVVGCSADLTAKGFHAGKIVKDVALAVEGNGGGRPDFAVGGGKRVDKADEAMAVGRTRITEQLSQLKEA